MPQQQEQQQQGAPPRYFAGLGVHSPAAVAQGVSPLSDDERREWMEQLHTEFESLGWALHPPPPPPSTAGRTPRARRGGAYKPFRQRSASGQRKARSAVDGILKGDVPGEQAADARPQHIAWHCPAPSVSKT